MVPGHCEKRTVVIRKCTQRIVDIISHHTTVSAALVVTDESLHFGCEMCIFYDRKSLGKVLLIRVVKRTVGIVQISALHEILSVTGA